MEEGTPNPALPSAPIVPTLPEIENSTNPFNQLNTPAPYVREFGSLMPIVPNGVPDMINTNKQLEGDFHTGPNPGAKPVNQKNGTLDYVKAIGDHIGDPNSVRDEHKFGRTYSYGAGYKNMNFDRYYKHPKFDKLGFNPYRDNDAHYNERSSWWDDFSRMRGEWAPLAWSGFKSIWGDENEANEAMEKGMAIGTSSKDGFGAKVTNFGLNSAYTVGVMGEIIMEDLALAAIESASFGTATPEVGAAAVARNSMAFGRLGKAWEGIHTTMKAMSVGDVKQLWEAGKSFGKFVNPLERSMQFTKDLYKGSNGMQHLTDLAKVTKGFGSFYRDFREMNVAHSEALLEGAGASSKYQEQLLDEFYAQHGRMPEGKEADEIFERAQSIKASVTLANDLAIYYSNKLVFEDLFQGFRPGSKIADAFLEGSGRTLKRTAAKGYKVGANVIEAEAKSGLKKTKDFLLKSQYVPWSRKYLVGNIGEALQESSQEIIQLAAKDYYDKIHKDPSQVGFYSTLASIGKGTSDQFSAQGLETFLSGYLMGSLIQGGSRLATKGYEKIKGTDKLAKEQAEQTDNDIMNAANHVARNAMVYGDYNTDMASAMNVANKERRAKTEQGDEKTARDLSDELQIQYFTKLAKTKNMGLITGHVDDMLNLEDNELAEAYGVPESQVADVRTKLNTLKERAENFQDKYDTIKEKLPNEANPWMFDPQKNPEAYKSEMEKYLAHEAAVSDLLFATEDYTRITERMSNIAKDLNGQSNKLKDIITVLRGGSAVANAAASDISILIDPIDAKGTLRGYRDQISVMKQGTAEQQREAAKLEKKRDDLVEWFKAVDQYKIQMAAEQKDSSVNTVQEAIDNMYKAYSKYIKNVASDKKGHVFEENLQAGFKHIKDFYALEHDAANMVSTINALTNPEYFDKYKNIQADIQKMKEEQRLAKLQEALDTFNNMKADNKFLNALYDLGVFVFPEDVDNLSRFEVVDFYDVASKDIVKPGTEKYSKIMDLMDEYSKGRTRGKRTPEKGTTPEAKEQSQYNTQARPKLANDNRTYKDLGEQYNFDPSSPKSKVPVENVLRSILTSKYATAAEKTLARRLLSTAKPDAFITFVNNLGNPGRYNVGTGEIEIDPRYTAADYKNGDTPLEHVILHKYLHLLTVDALNTDTEFTTAITNLNKAVKDYLATPEGKAAFGEAPLYGTANEKKFVAEALTNPTFQAALKQIPYTVTGKVSNAWDEFLNTVQKFLRRLLKLGEQNTALEEAMYIITSNIDKGVTGKKQATTTTSSTTLRPNELVTTSTPISTLRTTPEGSKLANRLLTAYHGYLMEQELSPANGTDDQIFASEGFARFMKETPTAAEIIAEFNKDREPKGPEPITKKKVTPNIWAVGNRKLFSGTVGGVEYTELPIEVVEYSDYYDNDAQENVKEVIAKNLNTGELIAINLSTPSAATFKYPELSDKYEIKTEETATPPVEKAEPVGSQEKEEEYTMLDEYNDITTKAELDQWKEKVIESMYNPSAKEALGELFGLTFNSENVNKLIADKEKGLAMNVNFDLLTPGKVVILKDNRKMVVKSKTGDNVVLVSTTAYKTNDPTAKTISIAKGVIKDQIKMIHGDFIHKAEKEVGPTAEEIQDSNKALEEASKDETEQIKEDTEKAKTMSSVDAKKALLEKIQKCKKG